MAKWHGSERGRNLSSIEMPSTLSPIYRLLESPPRVLLIISGAFALATALLDSVATGTLGILYIIPMLTAAPVLRRWQIVVLSLVFAALREHFAPFGWDVQSFLRMSQAIASFLLGGLFAHELVSGRRRALDYSHRLQEQVELRREAENQLRSLIESSPAAIITLDTDGRIDLANQAAHELFAVQEGALIGASIRNYLPFMAELLTAASDDLPYRTAANARGRRANGESFVACVWFATYGTRSGKRLAAIITDSSEDLRDWQETSLQSLLRSTRVLVGSVSHEIRNICAAIAMVHANLGRIEGVMETEDYAALGTLAQGLARLATVDLHASSEQEVGEANLDTLIEEFRIVVAPTLEANEVELRIQVQKDLPHVLGDHHGLLQVLLNLSRNSFRALEHAPVRVLKITVNHEDSGVIVRFVDSGAGVAHPERLFQPFQQGADAVGLGLFVSRAIVRACDGELYHEPSAAGCIMCLRLRPCSSADAGGDWRNSEVPA